MHRFRLSMGWVLVALLLLSACHRGEPEGLDSLVQRKISIADKFYDVDALSADHVIVVGYGGKILLTENAGRSWEVIPSGVDKALYSVEFVDDRNGWISGQDGVILHTTDGGRTWQRQKSGAQVYLFALDFVDANEGWAVGDRATYLHTRDGGASWRLGKVGAAKELSADEALLAQDPVLYGVQFLDSSTGWIVGELGNIFHTSDGGRNWKTQQESLLGNGIFDMLDLPTFFGVSFIDDENGIAAGLEGRIARTRNGGASWSFDSFKLDVPFADPLFQPFQFTDSTGWVVGAAGEVVRQFQADTPWKRASLGMEILTWLRGVDFLNEQEGWIVGGYGLILHTTDGGKSWLPSIA